MRFYRLRYNPPPVCQAGDCLDPATHDVEVTDSRRPLSTVTRHYCRHHADDFVQRLHEADVYEAVT